MRRSVSEWSLLLLCTLVCAAAVDAEEAVLGRKIENFELQDYRGKTYQLADDAPQPLVVVAFLGTECPLAKLYAPRLAQLAKEYQPQGVAFVAIDSNQQDSIAELGAFARAHEITFPLLKDPGNVVADRFAAERTPVVFVLDQERIVRYHGRIDDQYGYQPDGLAYQQSQPRRRNLAIALDELLSDQAVSEPYVAGQGCLIGRVRVATSNGPVTYCNQVARILNANCVFCHRLGQIAPFSLTSYEDASGWAEMIREVVQERRMPPWHADPQYGHFANDARLSDEDQRLLVRWVDDGAPEGDRAQLPEPVKFAPGWQIPEPDVVLAMSDKPFQVPAEGTLAYQRFTLDPGWKEDRWLTAIEPKPGNPAVVHHIIVYLLPPRSPKTAQAKRLKTMLLAATAPGVRQHVWPEGLAQYIPAGSKLIFEMHYTPNGTAQEDLSSVGLVFSDPKTVQREVVVQAAGNFAFAIPPHADNHRVESSYTFRDDMLLLSMSPHMHLRGKDFKYELTYPDGRTETLLSVPRYDFGWQTIYLLAEPKPVPKGSTLHCVAHFDNSENNLANPDPTTTVRWGEQSWEEMMFGWFDVALADQDLTQDAKQEVPRVELFLQRMTAAPEADLEPELVAAARRALNSDQEFELFAYQLRDLVPQIDRVCVTFVDGSRIRARQVVELAEIGGPLANTTSTAKAAGDPLADYLQSTETVIHQDLTEAKSGILRRMVQKGIFSSMHVPIRVNGVPMSVNFWSAETKGFPPQAADLLGRVVPLMVEGRE